MMARRRTVTDRPERVRATVVPSEGDSPRDRIRQGVELLREVSGALGELFPREERENNPTEYDDQPAEPEGDEGVIWPEIAEHIDEERYLETVDEIAELGHRLDGEDSPDADRFLAAQHYLQLLEDGADDFDESYVRRTWRTWIQRAKQKAPEFSDEIEGFVR